MIVWYSKELKCPMCGCRLCGREVGGGFAVDQDSDLLVRMKGRHIIQAEIHTCSSCRYSGYTSDFRIKCSSDIGEKFCAEVMPNLKGGPKSAVSSTPLPDVQYQWAYEASTWLGRSNLRLGNLLLRAYWCLRLPPSSHLPGGEIKKRQQKYLGGSIDHFKQTLRGNRDPYRYYLLGELCRRAGQFDLSKTYFNKFLTKKDTANYLQQAAVKLGKLADQSDSKHRTITEMVTT